MTISCAFGYCRIGLVILGWRSMFLLGGGEKVKFCNRAAEKMNISTLDKASPRHWRRPAHKKNISFIKAHSQDILNTLMNENKNDSVHNNNLYFPKPRTVEDCRSTVQLTTVNWFIFVCVWWNSMGMDTRQSADASTDFNKNQSICPW